MGRKNIDAFWDRVNLLNINNNFIELYKDFDFTFELKKQSGETIEYAKKVNSENKEVQKQLNGLVIESGNANAEVSQARGGYSVLNERLKESDNKLNNTQRVINITARGAIGDGVTDNYRIIQDAITEAEIDGSSIYIPSGTFYISKNLETKHMTSYNYRFGIKIFGNGKDSILTRNAGKITAVYT